MRHSRSWSGSVGTSGGFKQSHNFKCSSSSCKESDPGCSSDRDSTCSSRVSNDKNSETFGTSRGSSMTPDGADVHADPSSHQTSDSDSESASGGSAQSLPQSCLLSATHESAEQHSARHLPAKVYANVCPRCKFIRFREPWRRQCTFKHRLTQEDLTWLIESSQHDPCGWGVGCFLCRAAKTGSKMVGRCLEQFHVMQCLRSILQTTPNANVT